MAVVVDGYISRKPVEGAEAYLTDLPKAQLHLLDTGHFALEEELEFIADKMNQFLA